MNLKPDDFQDIDPAAQLQPGSYQEFNSSQSFVIGYLKSSVTETFKELTPNTTTHFFSCSSWSCHEVLTWILSHTGPAEVTIGVWSISELAARKLVDLLESGVITSLKAVLDYRSKNRHPSADQLAKHSFTQVRTFPMHAKVTVVKNDKWSVCLNGSANYTNNPRPESGFLSTVPETAEFYEKMLLQILNHANPFE